MGELAVEVLTTFSIVRRRRTTPFFEVAESRACPHVRRALALSRAGATEVPMLGVIYSVLAYLGFLATFSYLALFTAGVLVPKHVDSGAMVSTPEFLLVNLGLVLLWGLQHSLMARARFKRALTRVIPTGLERSTYVFASDAVLALLLWQWRPLPHVLWDVEMPGVRAVLWSLCALGWLGVPAASLLIDHFDLVGLKQAFARFRGSTLTAKGFVTPVLYRYVRHPMMSFLLLGLWATPHMTLGHLLLSVGLSAYVFIGVHFEERSLRRQLGLEYLRYQTATPRFLPGLKVRRRPDARSSDAQSVVADTQRG
jgi:protein-S-isoprenylcysteine O-methyltransferase Ste14